MTALALLLGMVLGAMTLGQIVARYAPHDLDECPGWLIARVRADGVLEMHRGPAIDQLPEAQSYVGHDLGPGVLRDQTIPLVLATRSSHVYRIAFPSRDGVTRYYIGTASPWYAPYAPWRRGERPILGIRCHAVEVHRDIYTAAQQQASAPALAGV